MNDLKLLFRNARRTLLLGVVLSAQAVAGANLNMATSHATRFGAGNNPYLVVSISEQKLLVMQDATPIRAYTVSTSKFGIGSESGSNKTPLGMHKICYKTGEGVPVGGIFKARQFTGSTATIHTDETDVPQDLITSRLMWLEGLEPGLNKGDGIDSYKRYIYIHGTNEEGLIGHPSSHGCVRMKNQEVVELYSLVAQGTLVYIQD